MPEYIAHYRHPQTGRFISRCDYERLTISPWEAIIRSVLA